MSFAPGTIAEVSYPGHPWHGRIITVEREDPTFNYAGAEGECIARAVICRSGDDLAVLHPSQLTGPQVREQRFIERLQRETSVWDALTARRYIREPWKPWLRRQVREWRGRLQIRTRARRLWSLVRG